MLHRRPVRASNAARGKAPPVAVVVVDAGPREAEARLVDVSLVASPPAARFTLDGLSLQGNPYKGRLPSDEAPHTLEATAPGFVTETRPLRFDGAVQVELSLKPERTRAAARARPSEPPTARTAKPIDTRDPYGPEEMQ